MNLRLLTQKAYKEQSGCQYKAVASGNQRLHAILENVYFKSPS